MAPERVDGAELSVRDLPDLLTAGTLFAENRMIIIKGLSQNAAAWKALSDMLPRLSDDITLVLVESKPDKRTSIFKTIKVASEYYEMALWTDRDVSAATAWVVEEASSRQLKLDKKIAQLIVERVGFDPWELSHAIDKLLAVAEDTAVDEQIIIDVIDARPIENIFELFELAIKGRKDKLHKTIASLELSEDPYRLFALLSSQVFQLSAVSSANQSDKPSSDFGIHPFVASKLASQSRQVSNNFVNRAVQIFAKADADLKSSRGDAWMIIEKALVEITT